MADAPHIAKLLKQLEHPGLKAIDLSLGRIEEFLAALGNPEQHIPPVIHIAGTNGKGSLVAYLQAIFEQAGNKVHRFTSPHLVRFNERIVIAGTMIDDVYLYDLLQQVEKLSHTHPVTFFESTTAAALLAFSQHPADVTLLEVGMGGRLDATNVLEAPMLTVITPVSLDHCEFLGPTLADVAGEKAGIIKANVPCVVGPQQPEALHVIERVAKEKNAPLFRHGQEWHVEPNDTGFRYRSVRQDIQLPLPNLPGHHQLYNAATAIACMETISSQFPIPTEVFTQAVKQANWPGRLQHLTGGALQTHLPDGCELWLDGGHNPAAGIILGEWAKQKRDQPLYVVVGMMGRKDMQGFLSPIAPHISAVYTLPVPGEPACQDPQQLAAVAAGLGVPSQTLPTVADCLHFIQMQANAPYRVLICGSLYLAGAVLAENY